MPAIAGAVATMFVAEAVSAYVVSGIAAGSILGEAILGAAITGTMTNLIGAATSARLPGMAGP